MAGRILILDSVATNRIVLKVKMAAAQYDVESCATQTEAESLIQSHSPDLLLINMTDPVEDRYEFCRNLRKSAEHGTMGIICVGVPDTARARFAALDCGADDVLPRPISDTLMMARIRSLLRQRNIGLEWQLRDGTRRALGFEETAQPMIGPINAAALTNKERLSDALHDRLSRAVRRPIATLSPHDKSIKTKPEVKADLLIIDGTDTSNEPSAIFRLIAELQSDPDTRVAAQLAILPNGRDDIAAMALDLGADDIAFDVASPEELRLRINSLMVRKAKRDRLNNTVRDGLTAAVTDPLTGLYNRRYADKHLARISEQARKTGRSYALMVVDIDHFKMINDTYGHAAGDDVLRALSERLRLSLRSIDLLARIGGEEFLIVMPDTSANLARLTADRLRRLVNDAPFAINNRRQTLSVTVSVGVAVDLSNDDHEESSSDLMGRADAALYCAKAAGRNMVSMSTKEAA